MDLIKTGIKISKTIKNATRLREIITVFARNGLDELILKSGLQDKIPNFVVPKSRLQIGPDAGLATGDWPEVIGYRLRKSFEELGPGFIKIGQLLATREDYFDPGFIAQLKRLQNRVRGIEFSEAKATIEKAIGCPIEDVFDHIDEIPIGTASIAVVYRAQLKTGEDVVIKVRRPGIVSVIETDFSVLHMLMTQLERVSDEIKYIGMSRVIEDFATAIQLELDFRIEAMSCEKLRNNIEKRDENKLFYLPHIHKDWVFEDVMVMECLKGTPFSELVLEGEAVRVVREKLAQGVDVFMRSLLLDGFFHADLHGGNFLLLENGKIGIIDFGMMGHLSTRNRAKLVAILYALVNNNFDSIVHEFLDIAEYEMIPDQDALVRDMKNSLAPFLGLSVQDTNFPVVVRAIVTTLAKHRIYLPRDWFVIFRALITMNGVGRSIGLDINIYEIIEREIQEIIQELFSKKTAIEESIWIGKDFLDSLRIIPRHMRWFLREWSKRNYAWEVDIKNLDRLGRTLGDSVSFLAYVLLSAALVISGTYLMHDQDHVPTISWIFWSMAFALFLFGFAMKRRG